MTVVSLPGSATSLTLAEAVARFLDRYRDQKHTATTYAETLTHLRAVAGGAGAAGALTPEVFAAAIVPPGHQHCRGRMDRSHADPRRDG